MGLYLGDLISSLSKGSTSPHLRQLSPLSSRGLEDDTPTGAEGEENPSLLYRRLKPHCASCFSFLIKTACPRNN